MKDVFFKPWVGANYGQKDSIFEQKILVLGDSHYADEGDIADGYDGSCDFTTGVMHDYLDQSIKGRWKSTFTKFMNSFVLNSEHEGRSPAELWNSVAFYNYLQVPAGSSIRQTQYFSYTKEKNRNAFLEVVEALSPNIIVSWGNKVWDVMPGSLGYGNYRANEERGEYCCLYPFKNGYLKLIGVTHPSTSYDSAYWANVFTKLGVNA